MKKYKLSAILVALLIILPVSAHAYCSYCGDDYCYGECRYCWFCGSQNCHGGCENGDYCPNCGDPNCYGECESDNYCSNCGAPDCYGECQYEDYCPYCWATDCHGECEEWIDDDWWGWGDDEDEIEYVGSAGNTAGKKDCVAAAIENALKSVGNEQDRQEILERLADELGQKLKDLMDYGAKVELVDDYLNALANTVESFDGAGSTFTTMPETCDALASLIRNNGGAGIISLNMGNSIHAVAVSYNQGTDQYTIYNINATGGDLTVPSATFESGDLSITGSTNLNIYINLDHGVVLVDDPH